MADSLRKTLSDGIRGIIDTWVAARPRLAAMLLAGNKTRETKEGTARRNRAASPKDFPIQRIEVELRGHSGWNLARSLAAQQQSFMDGTADFTVLRDARVIITVRYAIPASDAREYDPTEQVSLKDEVVNALFAAGPRLGISVVASAPTFDVQERDTRDNEQPQPGKVATVTVEFKCQQSGRALLAEINAA